MTSLLCVNRNYICNSTGSPALHDRTSPGSFPKYSLITLEWEFSVSGKQLHCDLQGAGASNNEFQYLIPVILLKLSCTSTF